MKAVNLGLETSAAKRDDQRDSSAEEVKVHKIYSTWTFGKR